MRTSWRISIALFALLGINVVPSIILAQSELPKLLQQANDQYYNLRKHGFKSFQATVRPNWHLIFQTYKAADSEQVAKAIRILDSIHFRVTLDSESEVTVTHVPDPPSISGVVDYNRVVHGMETGILGFFTSWKALTLTPIFPEGLEYKVARNDEYVISYSAAGGTFAVTLSNALLMTMISSSSLASDVKIMPEFTQGSDGLIVKSIASIFSRAVDGKYSVKVDIEHTDVEGLHLPSDVKVFIPELKLHEEWIFSDYEIVTK